VLRGTRPRRVDLEPAGPRVLDERLVKAGLERVGSFDDRGEVVGINVTNTPPKNTHAASRPAITASVAWRWVSHTK
jgi:hypothetical protein